MTDQSGRIADAAGLAHPRPIAASVRLLAALVVAGDLAFAAMIVISGVVAWAPRVGVAAAVRRAAGDDAYGRIAWQPDPQIQAIVAGWPQALAAPRAEALGFARDSGIDEVVAAFIEDDLPLQRRLGG